MITACAFISDPLSALQYGRSRTTVMWIKRVTPEDMLRSDVTGTRRGLARCLVWEL